MGKHGLGRPVERTRRRALAALQQCALFEHVSANQLHALLDEAEVLALGPGDRLFAEEDPADEFYVLLDGALRLTARRADGSPAVVGQINPTACVGEADMAEQLPRHASARAVEASTVLRIDLHDFLSLVQRSSGFRAGVRRADLHAVAAATRQYDEAHVDRVALTGDPGLPLAALTRLVAEVLAREEGQRVLVVAVRPDGGGALIEAAPAIGAAEAAVVAGDAQRVLDSAAWTERTDRVDLVMFDLSGCPAAVAAGFHRRLNSVAPISASPTPAPPAGLDPRCVVRPVVLVPDGGWGGPRPEMPIGTCRLRFDPRRAARAKHLDDLGLTDRLAISRLARELVDHTVGLALGGGGAWGYAHVALIAALLDRGVPIDVVSGASFGAVVGAYFCRHGREGLQRVVDVGPRLSRAAALSLISTAAIERLMLQEVPGHLEDLDRVFLPVATQVIAGGIGVLRGTSIARGVRAASSFPLAFAATIDHRDGQSIRYVDGGIISNVPDSVLLAEGADFVLASNVVPPPKTLSHRPPLLPGRWGRAWSESNPIRRFQDGLRSAFILMHAAGEAEASFADVLFDAEPIEFLPTDFKKAEAIMARVQENVQRTADRAARKWARWRERRI